MYESVFLKSAQTSLLCRTPDWWFMQFVYFYVCTLFSLENTAHPTDQLYIRMLRWQCRLVWVTLLAGTKQTILHLVLLKLLTAIKQLSCNLQQHSKAGKVLIIQSPTSIHRQKFFGKCSFRLTVGRWILAVHCLLHGKMW